MRGQTASPASHRPERAQAVRTPANVEREIHTNVQAALAAALEPVLAELAELRAIVARLQPPAAPARLLTTEEKAAELGRTAEWVRDHRQDLGVVSIGDGSRPRLYFPPGEVTVRCADSTSQTGDSAARPTNPRPPKSRANGSGTHWRPIHAGSGRADAD